MKCSKVCTILVVIIVKITFVNSFFFYCLLYNHSFKTNPNTVTNLSKLFNYICSCVAFLIQLQVPEGQFAEGTGNPSGATCFAGTYTSKRGSSSCVDCPAGNYCPAIIETCWGRSPLIDPLTHEGFFARPTTGCETKNQMYG